MYLYAIESGVEGGYLKLNRLPFGCPLHHHNLSNTKAHKHSNPLHQHHHHRNHGGSPAPSARAQRQGHREVPCREAEHEERLEQVCCRRRPARLGMER
jgi:hypothetical protein